MLISEPEAWMKCPKPLPALPAVFESSAKVSFSCIGWSQSSCERLVTFTALESCMMPDLELKVQEMGLVSKLVAANILSDS